ncbi:MAG: rRNA maturation RNase YbeY [Planctomycetota bacterium]
MPESNTQTNNLPDPNDPEPEPLSVEINIQHHSDASEDEIRQVVFQILNDNSWEFGEVSVAIVDDATIHQLNRQFLDHDYETDVLSFVIDQDPDCHMLNGEIIVSSDTASRVAKEEGVSTKHELLLYIIHGALHLAGFDDKDPAKRELMRLAESKYTSQFGIQYVPPSGEEIEEG